MELRRALWIFATAIGLGAGACEDDVQRANGVPADAASDSVGGDSRSSDVQADTAITDTSTAGDDTSTDLASGDTDRSDTQSTDAQQDAPDDTATDTTASDAAEEIGESEDVRDAAPDIAVFDTPADLVDSVDLVQSACGARAGDTCRADQYCDFPDNQCGAADLQGTCEPRPEFCPLFFQPVCGCDGTVHGNECDAYASGDDLNDFGGCPPPEGWMPCGPRFCTIGLAYCERFIPGMVGAPTTYTCRNLPPECGEEPDCDCLSDVACGDNCVETDSGSLQVTCVAP